MKKRIKIWPLVLATKRLSVKAESNFENSEYLKDRFHGI